MSDHVECLTMKDFSMQSMNTEAACTEAETLPRSNFDRLRGHLKGDNLASRLLDAWVVGDSSGAADRLRAVLDAQTITTPESDALSPSSQA